MRLLLQTIVFSNSRVPQNVQGQIPAMYIGAARPHSNDGQSAIDGTPMAAGCLPTSQVYHAVTKDRWRPETIGHTPSFVRSSASESLERLEPSNLPYLGPVLCSAPGLPLGISGTPPTTDPVPAFVFSE
jgi:hypothetical protein